MKKIFVLLLSALMLFVFAGTALASRDTESVSLDVNSLKRNAYGVNCTVKMNSTKELKTVKLERSAVNYLKSSGNDLTIVTRYMEVVIPYDALNTAAWQAADKDYNKASIEIKLDTEASADAGKYFGDAFYSTKKLYGCRDSAFELTARIYSTSGGYVDLTEFAAPVKVSKSYKWVSNPHLALVEASQWYWFDRAQYQPGVSKVFWTAVGGTYADGKLSGEITKTGLYQGVSNKQRGDGGSSAVDNTVPFTDIAGTWAESYIEQWRGRGYLPDAGTLFYPNQAITRGEFAAYLCNTMDLPAASTTLSFKDLSSDYVYYDALMRAAANGVVKGEPDGCVYPNRSISRQEMAVMMTRAMDSTGISYDTADALAAYADAASVSAWAKDGVSACINSKLMTGRAADRFAPTATTSKAEAVVILARLQALKK